MKNIKIVIASFLIIVSCKSITPIYKKEKLQNIEKLGYITPLYSYDQNSKELKKFKNFEKYTNKRVDSLFVVDAEKYKISKKVFSNEINKNEFKALFEAYRNGQQKPDFSLSIKSLLKSTDEDYIFIPLFLPKLTYLHGVIPVVRTSRLEVLIIETSTQEVVFYEDAHSSKKHSTKQLLDNLNKIYDKLNK